LQGYFDLFESLYGVSIAVDQAGQPRVVGAGLDMGALEGQNLHVPVAPQVVGVVLNGSAERSVSAIDPSGRGVAAIEVVFSKDVTFTPDAVEILAVTLDGGVETVVQILTPTAVTGSGTDRMTIVFHEASIVNTWVKVRLIADEVALADAATALDGEAPTDGSGRGYLYSALADLPTGDGLPGGDAVFYVGSLRGDLWGANAAAAEPDGEITRWDVAGFTAAFQTGDLRADLWGVGGTSAPDGEITRWDVAAFTEAYQAALASGLHLGLLPAGMPAAAAPGPQPLALVAEAGGMASASADVFEAPLFIVPDPVGGARHVSDTRANTRGASLAGVVREAAARRGGRGATDGGNARRDLFAVTRDVWSHRGRRAAAASADVAGVSGEGVEDLLAADALLLVLGPRG
jgi:hypothetical protein